MSWHRQRDYHGSRAYEADGAAAPRGLLALLRKLLKLGAEPSSSQILLHDGERRFSVLGADSPASPVRRAADCPFPTKPNYNRRDWRVHP